MNKKYFNKRVFVFLLIFGSLLAIQTFAWNNPSQNPPSGAASITADSSGNIGIGMTPTYKLDVTGNSVIGRFIGTGNPEIRVEDSGGSGATAKFGAYENGAGGVLGMVSAHDFRIFTSNAARITIKSGGDVGIGTANPGAKLEVNGQVKITGGTPGSGKVLTSDAAGLGSWQTASGGLSGSGSTNYMAKFTAGTTIGNSQIFDNGTNVSVGTNNPLAKLHAVTNVVNANGTPVLRITAGHYVSPVGSGAALEFGDNGGGNDTGFTVGKIRTAHESTGGQVGMVFHTLNSNSLQESMRLLSNGNLGVGLTNPSQKIEANGYVKGTGLCIGNDCRTSWPSSSPSFGVVADLTNNFISGTQTYSWATGYAYPIGEVRHFVATVSVSNTSGGIAFINKVGTEYCGGGIQCLRIEWSTYSLSSNSTVRVQAIRIQ